MGGCCPEHERPVEQVSERNWFFRLSRYAETLRDLIESGELQIDPEPYRNETLAFLRGDVRDLSVSRSRQRARGWGITVPGDPSQVVYVWFDALVNYLSALDYGTDGDRYRAWWRNGDERIHVVGKGIARFHAVYWPAFLLSAGVPPPTRVHVHPYLTVDGAKISKSGAGAGAAGVLDAFGPNGAEAFRWWSASDVLATADTSFSVDRLVERTDDDLANGIGNTVRRVVTLRRRAFGAAPVEERTPHPAADGLAAQVTAALAAFDRRSACGAIVAAVRALNQDIEVRQPWREPDRRLLDGYIAALREIVDAASVIAPELSARATAELAGVAPPGEPLWPRHDGR